jgi:hypothetical protein
MGTISTGSVYQIQDFCELIRTIEIMKYILAPKMQINNELHFKYNATESADLRKVSSRVKNR